MPEVIEIIEGLKELQLHFRAMASISSSKQGRANHIESARTIEDALALLKAQRPRVLTWDELIATDHVYIETNKDGQKYIVPGIVTIVRDTAVIASVKIGTRLIDGAIAKDIYGNECRCWTSNPTEEQRRATPWK